ncbi:pyrroline-5-carboxylate reductase dimerization-domain-containing protein, partial [Lineolata rhizophorae]
GTMGIAILSGIMSSLTSTTPAPTAPGTPSAEEPPSRLPTRFIACVRRAQSAQRIKAQLSAYASIPLRVVVDDNVAAARDADLVLLACKPQMYRDMLAAPGMAAALAGKLLISILAGVSVRDLEDALYAGPGPRGPGAPALPPNPCRPVRAMPNTASFVRESMTVIAASDPPLPPAQAALVTWIFARIGLTVSLPASAMDASTALCGSGPAFFALVLEAIADGGVAMGLPRAEAQLMAAQTMRGTTGLVLGGEHPAILRDKVSTPGGCTIGGLLVLEEGRVRGTVARAVREATVVAGQLGRGVQGVNGTRFAG